MKTILITNSESSVSVELMKEFAEEGYEVITLARDAKEEEEVRAKLPDVAVTFVYGDITETETLNDLVDLVQLKYGHLDILINNSGAVCGQSIEKISGKEWNETINRNVTALFQLTKSMLPMLKEAERGDIINITPIFPEGDVYSQLMFYTCTSAINAISMTLAQDLMRDDISVNVLIPEEVGEYTQVERGIVKIIKGVMESRAMQMSGRDVISEY